MIDDAQRPDGAAVTGLQRGSRVEPDVLLTQERIASHSRVQPRIFDDDGFVRGDDVSADRRLSRVCASGREIGRQPVLRFPELPVFINQRHERDGCVEDLAETACDAIERLLRGRIQQSCATQCVQARRLIGRNGRRRHRCVGTWRGSSPQPLHGLTEPREQLIGERFGQSRPKPASRRLRHSTTRR